MSYAVHDIPLVGAAAPPVVGFQGVGQPNSVLIERNIGVLITDHNVRETLGVCHRAYILSDGHIIAQGSAEEILANQQVRDVYLGRNFQL